MSRTEGVAPDAVLGVVESDAARQVDHTGFDRVVCRAAGMGDKPVDGGDVDDSASVIRGRPIAHGATALVLTLVPVLDEKLFDGGFAEEECGAEVQIAVVSGSICQLNGKPDAPLSGARRDSHGMIPGLIRYLVQSISCRASPYTIDESGSSSAEYEYSHCIGD